MKNKNVFRFGMLSLIAYLLLPVFCSNRNPNLSEKQLYAQTNDAIQITAENLFDTGYGPQTGLRHDEIRSVDPANRPAIIDIAGNLENKKAFKLSDFASSVNYIFLQQPPDTKFTSISEVVSDDNHIFVNTSIGLLCYSKEGQYLYTLCKNELETSYLGTRIVSGMKSGANIDLLNGRLVFRTTHWPSVDEGIAEMRLNVFEINELDAQMSFSIQSGELRKNEPQPTYQRQLDPTKDIGLLSKYLMMNDLSFFISNSLNAVAINGDTLCKFNDYDRPTTRVRVGVIPAIYRINGQVMLRNNYNDTIFRVEPPNRLIPVYVMQWGKYKPNINQLAAGSDVEGKLVLRDWIETKRYIFIEYTEGRAYPARWMEGKVNFHYAIYDKTAKTLVHHITSTQPPMREFKMGTMTTTMPLPPMFENDIEPVGMPFWPGGLNHKDEMYMTFSKEQIKSYIATGKFQNNKLQTIYDNMPDDGFCLMTVK